KIMDKCEGHLACVPGAAITAGLAGAAALMAETLAGVVGTLKDIAGLVESLANLAGSFVDWLTNAKENTDETLPDRPLPPPPNVHRGRPCGDTPSMPGMTPLMGSSGAGYPCRE
ncbi:MAG: hypothetical protein AAFS10_23820, partial [Myxococcota bacterium]